MSLVSWEFTLSVHLDRDKKCAVERPRYVKDLLGKAALRKSSAVYVNALLCRAALCRRGFV